MDVMIRWLIRYCILGVRLVGKTRVYYSNKILLYAFLEGKGATLNGNVNVLSILFFFQVMLLLFFRYIIGYNIIHGKYAAAVLATPRGSKRTVVDLNPGRAYACTMYIQSIQVEKLCVRPITLSN